jgi:hypothetical protein
MLESTDTVTWECGTFRYYVPDIGSDEWTRKAVAVLFGYDPSPSQLYQLYPWTWLGDWFSNVGDIISNLSSNAVDNETLTNAFAMRTISRSRTLSINVDWDDWHYSPFDVNNHWDYHVDLPAGSDEYSYSYTEDEYLRRQATPYGFGFDMSSCSARQLAILAALAISKSK